MPSSFPIERPDARLELVRLHRAPEQVVVILRLVILEEPDSVARTIKEQELVYPTPFGDDELRAMAERARRHFDTLDELDLLMPSDLVRAPTPYRPVGRGAGVDLADAIRAQAHEGGFEARFERMGDWPVAPRTVYFLDLALAMIGGGGCEVFLGQNDVEEVIGVLEAADEAGCSRFAEVYRRALGLAARRGSGEFLAFVDEDWLEGELIEPDDDLGWRDLDHHDDGGTWSLLETEVRPALARYLAAHHATLVAE